MSDEETQDLTQFRHDYHLTDCIATLELEPADPNTFETAGKCKPSMLTVRLNTRQKFHFTQVTVSLSGEIAINGTLFSSLTQHL